MQTHMRVWMLWIHFTCHVVHLTVVTPCQWPLPTQILTGSWKNGIDVRCKRCALVPLCPWYHSFAPESCELLNSAWTGSRGTLVRWERQKEVGRERVRDGWESLIELVFQVWIYSADPALVHTRAHRLCLSHTHTQISISRKPSMCTHMRTD